MFTPTGEDVRYAPLRGSVGAKICHEAGMLWTREKVTI